MGHFTATESDNYLYFITFFQKFNSVLDFYGSPAVYDEAGATVPTSFDGMEDHTFYVFTDPDRAVTGRDGE